MITEVEIGGRRRRFDLARAESIALPLIPGGTNPRFFTTEEAGVRPLKVDTFTGTVTAGGSCNASVVTFAPHCHGTHTEGPGHLGPEAGDVHACLDNIPLPARLVSVRPHAAATTDEHYVADLPGDYPVITRDQLETDTPAPPALVIRTLPNDPSKRTRDYGRHPDYPVLTTAAAAWLVRNGVRHLYIDTPSLDCAADGGRLGIHRIFWGMAPDGRVPAPDRERCTVTEMIHVPDHLADGHYLVWPGLSPLTGEATPSAPCLVPETL